MNKNRGCPTVATLVTLAALSLATAPPLFCAGSSLAHTPPLGYNTWNAFAGEINETVIREQADRLVSTGLCDLGYKYVVVDDGWSEPQRDADGRMVADRAKFPSGMRALADYLHSRGLLFGIYSDSGSRTCQGLPGSRGHEAQDAADWAEMGVDFLKYDNCWAEDDILQRFRAMGRALQATGRPILYAVCSWGVGDPWLWGPKVAHTWRTTMDIGPSYMEVLHKLDDSVGLARYSSHENGFADLDMLEVGNFPETEDWNYIANVERSHFLLWALMHSPLIIGTDLTRISDTSLALLKAEEVIAVNQDPLGVAGDLIWKQGPKEIYAAPLSSGRRAVAFFSRHTHKTQRSLVCSNITVRWHQVGYPPATRLRARDAFARTDLGVFAGNFTAKVAIHGTLLVVFTPLDSVGERFNDWRPWQRQPIFEPHPEDASWIRPEHSSPTSAGVGVPR